MLKEKAGNVAGQIWTALNGTDGKVSTSEVEGELFVNLN